MSTAVTTPRRDPAAAREAAYRLSAKLGVIRETLMDAAEDDELDGAGINHQMIEDATQIGFAAELLASYAAGLSLVTPNPETNAYLVQRISVEEALPENTDTVLVWSDADGLPLLGWYDGTIWRHVDAMPVENVTGWALRPGGR